MSVFITANLGRHVDTAEFLANVRVIDDEAGRGTVIGFQEIDEADTPNEHHGLRRVLEDFTWAGWQTREPIGFGDRWKIQRDEVVKAATGLKVGRVGLSPARTITDAVATHTSGAELAFLDVHYPRNDPRLLSRWRDVRQAHADRIAHHHAEGRTVVWFSDVNRRSFMPLHRAERTLAHHGLDWVRCVEHPDGAQIEVLARGSIDLTIDGHDAQWARVRLTNPKEHR
ncbi:MULTISPECIES: hypothetical protein [unclassified Nocardioides]|uniref:hypothetical protein n=1 Tax=unclassified Nocardioides TaxID=2615069 RepID=UPI0009F02D24|nr:MULTISPECIES: hypothetical protein [unclassified Nocardioides]GAW50628.1 hypothetical protein PD653B2_2964 [Nocardioides sp. PD653-B2]GAW55527.1 hypothetical protein PD653_2952 [Nocardioides sp. PD653]